METRQMNIDVLDSGYCKLVESWGSDKRIIESARMSTNKGFQGWGPLKTNEPCKVCGGSGTVVGERLVPKNAGQPTVMCSVCHGDGLDRKPGDEKLLRYLYRNKHLTPFEMAGLTVEVQAPIFVFRQWQRHRTQSYNEMSARYTELPDMFYVPSARRLMADDGNNKQAGRKREINYTKALSNVANMAEHLTQCVDRYHAALADGVPRELARLYLPVAHYSRMRASANLRNWLGFLTLRLDPHAQFEIREYAKAIASIIEQVFPRTYALFSEGQS